MRRHSSSGRLRVSNNSKHSNSSSLSITRGDLSFTGSGSLSSCGMGEEMNLEDRARVAVSNATSSRGRTSRETERLRYQATRDDAEKSGEVQTAR
jgi:hypothetical protein